jgi:hypothetical protein
MTLYVGLYQEEPGMTNQLTTKYPGRPILFLRKILHVSDRLDTQLLRDGVPISLLTEIFSDVRGNSCLLSIV